MPIKIVPRKSEPKDIDREDRKKISMKEAIDMRRDARRDYVRANRMLTGGQAKLDKNKNNKIDAEDFKLLRKEKKGRPMKAKRGKFSDVKKFAKAKGLPVPFTRAGNFGKMAGNFPAIKTAPGSMASKAEAVSKMKSAKELTKEAGKKFLKRRLGVGAALASGIGGALGVGSNALKNLKKKRAAKKRDEAKVKKMGGGMMKKYNKGGTPMYLTDEKIKEVFPEKDAKRRARISQLVGGDRVSPMKGDRFQAGQTARRKKMFKEFGKKVVRAALPGAGAALAAKKVKEKVSGKMGGGMMQRPMGMGMAKKGKMIKARGGGMARTKPTSMY
tara:strand:+ start:40 stop:1026 length:987 start_codon:yes stop_codon:yes gene_type:complete